MGIVSLKVPQGGMIEAIVRLPSPLLGDYVCPLLPMLAPHACREPEGNRPIERMMSWVRSGGSGDSTLGERALCALLESSYGVVTGEKGYICS